MANPASLPFSEAIDFYKSKIKLPSSGWTDIWQEQLFVKGSDKEGDNFKWLAEPEKADRLKYINLLAMTLIEPDEIWWAWEKDAGDPAKWRLKRRYVKAFEIDGDGRYGVGVFEWSKAG